MHWIEASAGSGKTFTLSSLLVRILLEKHLPKHVVATTFTRAAAAELKQRIRLRLIEIHQFFKERQGFDDQANIEHLKQLKAESADPLKIVLLEKFYTQVTYACSRLQLVLEQLDELFVGTLDSFSQKLLREFAFESGKIERVDITDQSKQYTEQLIHDVLREWLQQQSQQQVDWFYMTGRLKPTHQYIKIVEEALNFTSAYFKPVQPPKIEIEKFLALREKLRGVNFSHLAPYYLADGDFFPVVNKNKFTKDSFTILFEKTIPEAIERILKEDGHYFFLKEFAKARAVLEKFVNNIQDSTVFIKKCAEQDATCFYNDEALQKLVDVLIHTQHMESTLVETEGYLKYHLCEQVKLRLPALLQQQSETTFAQQIKTLSEALQGEQGEHFAAFVQTSYPLILVDEFQDTNQEQDNMLASIWRAPKRYENGCMIMVGDRKQAIYGFRGGDMLTFIRAYHDVLSKKGYFYRLKYNHRTIQPLVEAVDALFMQQPDFGEHVIYEPVEAGTRPHPSLIDENKENPKPLRWLHMEGEVQPEIQVAWKISTLLQQGQQGKLYLSHDHLNTPIIAKDIAVLSKNHDGLDKVQFELERLGIRVNRPSKRSVFDGLLAQDVAAVLTAIMNPYDEKKVKRALLSRMLGYTLKNLNEFERQTDGLGQFISVFSEIREIWFERHFLAAWQYCLRYFDVWRNLVRFESRDNERSVVNLRHLSDLLSQHSGKYQGPKNLFNWYLKQVTSPSDREWELERSLSNNTGIPLMTIHQSKGLEFKIVFLLNANGSFQDKETLNFSMTEQVNEITQQAEKQRVIAIKGATSLSDTEKKQHLSRLKAEQNRLWYVALTRASHRIYVVLNKKKGKTETTSGVNFWRVQPTLFNHISATDEPLLTSKPLPYKEDREEVVELSAIPQPQLKLYPRLKTSFSALAQHLTKQQALDVLATYTNNETAADDEVLVVESINDIDDVSSNDAEKISWIARNFPMGTHAGNFLHEIFEHLDFQDQSSWDLEIYRRFKNDYSTLKKQVFEKYQVLFDAGIHEQDYEERLIADVKSWLNDILSTPFGSGFMLGQLKPNTYLSEFPFYLALSDQVFASQRIHQLFQEYDIFIPTLNSAESSRFLNGSIDLVYQSEGKYYIADYKSNFLGETVQSYTQNEIAKNMSQSSYWLQASLYLVALHRYLKERLHRYDIEQHLGGATYLYLRGMTGQKNMGVCHWQPSTEFIQRLDAMLGYYINR
nr:UvrD-helicase domain-containing protein [Acinetobacter nectaris]